MRSRIVAVLPDHPYPLDMGSRVRNLRILEALATEFDLTIVTLVHYPHLLEEPGPVAKLGRWVPVPAPHRRSPIHKLAWHLRARWSQVCGGIHRETFFQSFPVLSRTVEEIVRRDRPAFVHAAYWYALRHLAEFARPTRWIVDTHDVQYERQARLWGRVSPREKGAELRELRRYDRVIAITEHDRSTLAPHLEAGGPPCEVIGMGLDMDQWSRPSVEPALPEAPRVVFYGNLSNRHNQEAVFHLVREILPPIAARVKNLELLILGADPPAEIRESLPRICPTVVTGFVEDVRPWLVSASVFALSLQSGSGQRGRVVESLALGVPVIGYRGGLEGLELSDGEGIGVVDDSERFQEQLLFWLENKEARTNAAETGRRCVEQRYGYAATYGKFPRLYRQILDGS